MAAYNPNPTLAGLASEISTQVEIINNYLAKSSHAQPSFAVTGLRSWDEVQDGAVQTARLSLIEYATDLLHLAMGPEDYVKYQPLTLKFDHFVLDALNRWNVYNAVPLDGSITYLELSEKVNIPEQRLRRVLRHAISNRVFQTLAPDAVAHTSLSAQMVHNPLLNAWIGHILEETLPASISVFEAMEKYGTSEDPSHAGFAVAYGLKDSESLFHFLEADGEVEPCEKTKNGELVIGDRAQGWRARRFGAAMKYMMAGGLHAASHANNGFDWQSLGKGTVVDVGGSTGHVSLAIASAYPDLTFVVQDFESLRPQFEITIPADLKDRISFQEHDFFTPQPVKGADVYFFKHIMHDWSDHLCIEILRNIVPAMQSGNRILVMDGVMPEIGETSNFVLRLNSSLDLQMMAVLNAKERRAADWMELFEKADKRLVLKSIKQPPGSAASIIEVVFEG